jgi:hypothetical protein
MRRAKLKQKLLDLGLNFKAINSKLGTIIVPESRAEEVLQLLAFIDAKNDYVVISYKDGEPSHDDSSHSDDQLTDLTEDCYVYEHLSADSAGSGEGL